MRLTLLYIGLCALLMVGCSEERPTNGHLLRADRLVFHAPQEALHEMMGLRDDTLTAPADRALCFLLQAEAFHHTGSPAFFPDSTEVAVAYYERHADRPHLVRALLHRGIVLYGRQQYAEAVSLIKRAERLAEQEQRPELTYDVATVLGDINDNAAHLPLTLHYYRRALEAARATRDTVWWVRSMNNLAVTFHKAGQQDSLRWYAERAAPLAKQVPALERATTLSHLAMARMADGRTAEARRLLEEACATALTERATMLLADLRAGEGRASEAVTLWQSLLQSDVPDIRIHCYERLIDHYSRRQDAQRCQELYERLNRYYQQVYGETASADIVTWQALIDRQHHERQQYRLTIGLLSAVVALMGLLLLLGWYHRRRIRKLNTQIEELDARYMNWHMAERLLTAEPISLLHQLAAKGREPQAADWQALHKAVARESPDFVARLTAVALSPKEYNVCLLIRLRFLPSEIAALLGLSPQAVTNMRVRLLLKIFGMKGGARDFDSRMREM